MTTKKDGADTSSTRTSPNARCACESKEESEGTTTSPDRRKPKKHIQTAAHSIIASNLLGSLSQAALRSNRREGVIGSPVVCRLLPSLRKPLITYSSCGMEAILGS